MVDGSLTIPRTVLQAIDAHLEASYPSEGCGFLLGTTSPYTVCDHLMVPNRREGDGAAANRYLITPNDFQDAERRAAELGVQLIGTYHSHPDVAAVPSDYDREHAWPTYRYLIVRVAAGVAGRHRVWELIDDRSRFREHAVVVA